MSIIFFILYTQAILKEELYEYQIGQIVTHQEEDFLLLKPNSNNIDFQTEGAKIDDEKVVLISEINHRMDKIIDMKQNDYEKEDYVWILYLRDDKSILSKQSINDLYYKENYYLQLNFECYTFYFISNSQITIDCQDSISNIIVLFDIKNKIQQSFYYSTYKDVKLRKLLLVAKSKSFVLIQQEQFIFVCFRQNKYQICNQFTFENNAHTVHIYSYQITLLSEYLVDVFAVTIDDVYEIVHIETKNFANIQLEPNHQLIYYFHNPINQENYFVYDHSLVICYQSCFNYELDGKPLLIQVIQYYLIIQTNQSTQIVFMKNQQCFKIYHKFNNDFIMTNKNLHEVLLLNKDQFKFYGLTQSPYSRIKNQRQLILIDKYQYQFENSIDYLIQDYILFYEHFKFKSYYDFTMSQTKFVVIGGALNITCDVENQYKDVITIKQSYFIGTQHQDVQYFLFGQNQIQEDILIIINNDHQILNYNLANIHKQHSTLSNKQSGNLACLRQILNFNDAYYFNNSTNGQNFIMRLLKDLIEFVQLECLKGQELLWCNNKLCVCYNSLNVYITMLDNSPGIHLQKSEQDQIFHLDYLNQTIVLYLINNNHLNIKYYMDNRFFFSEIHSQTIKLCDSFINLVIFQFKLILVCSEEIILYNKLSNFRFVISGNVELYGEQFLQTSQVIQSDHYLYYIIDNQILYVFDSFLSVKQQYVTKMQIDKFSEVKAYNKHICFKQENNLKCYYYSINIKFNYESDQVQYHQAFNVNVCAENKYNKKCNQYITRLDQQNRGISINKNIYQIVVDEKSNHIKLGKMFYTGSVDKIYVNHIQLKPKMQDQTYLQLNSDQTFRSFFNGFHNYIYILNHESLTIYNIETRKTKSMTTKKRMFYILPYKKNLVLFGPYSITVVNCEVECKEIQYLEDKIPQQGFLQIFNNTLYSSYLGSLRMYNLDDLSQNKSIYQIDDQLYHYQIDVQQDKNGQICMVYLSYNGTLQFKHLENTKSYQILYLLKQRGVHLDWSNPDAIHSAKILDDCRLVLLGTSSGYYFLELSEDITFHAQIVVQDHMKQRFGQLIIGQSYIFYIQLQSDSLIIYKFTYAEIYNSEFIDFCKKIYKPYVNYDQSYDYFYAYNDELYQVQQRLNEYFINKLDLDTVIQFEKSQEKFLVELSNSDETKSFIIEIQVEEEDHLIFFTLSGFLIICYILLIYYKIQFITQQ